jgi:hypothetical protein
MSSQPSVWRTISMRTVRLSAAVVTSRGKAMRVLQRRSASSPAKNRA